MTDIELLKAIRRICNNRCNSHKEKEKEYHRCPFPWRFCDLDKNFYEMTDEELINVCLVAEDFSENYKSV